MMSGDRSVTEQWKRYDWEFHQALISACGSRVLMDTHASVFDKYLRYQMLSLTHRGQIAADEHLQLRDAALTRDAVKGAGDPPPAHRRRRRPQPCGAGFEDRSLTPSSRLIAEIVPGCPLQRPLSRRRRS